MIFVFQFTLLKGQPTVGVRNGKRVGGGNETDDSLSLSLHYQREGNKRLAVSQITIAIYR